jgi:segregation and condensation protein A
VSTHDFTVRLDRIFQGPMDLLLHLVREQEVEIQDVEIARVVDGYLQHLRAMRELDIEVAGEFLVMAATLMSIKSRSLLPRESVDLDEGLDPKDELIQRLIEYRRFRESSDALGRRWAERSQQHARGSSPLSEAGEPAELDLGEISVWDLLAQFSRLLRETLADRPVVLRADRRPLRHYVEELARVLQGTGGRTLRELVLSVEPEPTREGLVGSFCALLELARLGLVRLAQQGERGEIAVALREDLPGTVADVLRDTVFEDEAASEEPPGAAGSAAGQSAG